MMRMKKLLFCFLAFTLLAGPAAYSADVDTQTHRKNTINVCIRLGYFTRVDVEDQTPNLYVTPMFMGLSYNQKVGLVALVWHYYNDENPNYEKVIVREQATGKRVGVFSKAVGGLKMELD